MENLVGKKVRLNLAVLSGNGYEVMNQFKCVAKQQGWTDEEVEKVRFAAMSYEGTIYFAGDRLMQVLIAHTE